LGNNDFRRGPVNVDVMWLQMRSAMKKHDLADRIHDDPRGRTETEWLNSLDFLVDRLSEATSSHLELGRYWISDFLGHASAGMSARVRSKQPLKGVESDYWECAICLSGQDGNAWADAYIIPYLQSSRVTSLGRMADRSIQYEEQFWWFNFANGNFENKGWSYPDGPGEWSWVERPGDEYQQYVECDLHKTTFNLGDPVNLNVTASTIADAKKHRQRPRSSLPRISLIHVNRDREHTNLAPWTARPPRHNSQDAVTIDDLKVAGRDSIKLNLSAFRIRGGWTPGKYHVSLRLQNFHQADHSSWSSEISAPFVIRLKFTHGNERKT